MTRIGKRARAVERAQMRAQPEPVDLLQVEADDDEVVVAFGGAEQRLLRVVLVVDLASAASAPA